MELEPETVITNTQRNFQAVSFDVGGTLIQPQPSVGHIYAEVAAKHGVKDVSPKLLNEQFKVAWRSCNAFDYSRSGWEQLVHQTFRDQLPASASFFPELYQRFSQAEAWRVFEDVRPALERLRSQQIRLIAISNWDERLRQLLDRLGLSRYFEDLVISCEVGFAKPSPNIFRQAVMKLGLPASAILHVGDSLEMDYRGAKAAGFRAIHLRRGTQAKCPEAINSLAEL